MLTPMILADWQATQVHTIMNCTSTSRQLYTL